MSDDWYRAQCYCCLRWRLVFSVRDSLYCRPCLRALYHEGA